MLIHCLIILLQLDPTRFFYIATKQRNIFQLSSYRWRNVSSLGVVPSVFKPLDFQLNSMYVRLLKTVGRYSLQVSLWKEFFNYLNIIFRRILIQCVNILLQLALRWFFYMATKQTFFLPLEKCFELRSDSKYL